MESLKKLAASLMVVSALGFTGVMVGCEEEGPGEEIGESLDNAADDAGDNLENAGENVRDAAD